MKKYSKGLITGIIVTSVMTATTFSVAESVEVDFNKIKVKVNGQNVQAENVLINGRTYVPLRAISEILQKDVAWDANTSTASINDKNQTISNVTEIAKTTEATKSSVPAEYKSALIKAESYANTMHMSKKGVYSQLISIYGEKFTPEAAQYAIENVKSDWNANALAKAKTYQNNMNMSPTAIYSQLTSDYGEKFTKEEADYAIQHLNEM